MGEAIGEGHEAVNYSSGTRDRARLAFRVATVHSRAFNARARNSLLAWRRSCDHASSNGARLRESHCAVDPKKIPYGTEVVFPDAVCVAVDCGSDVINRKAALLCGRNVAERNAIVIDRFFETKQKALAWAKAHPHFMTVQILTSGTKQGTKLIATENPRLSPRNIASSSKTSWAGSAE
jgi:3D (Asp-Asp-Asp) domain-containing protein